MRGIIKGVLAEELENSLRLEKEYRHAIDKLPKGCLSLKRIKGHEYYYLVERKNGKLHYSYKGHLSPNEIQEYKEAKIARARNRRLLSKIKRQIKFLRSSLRGKEAV